MGKLKTVLTRLGGGKFGTTTGGTPHSLSSGRREASDNRAVIHPHGDVARAAIQTALATPSTWTGQQALLFFFVCVCLPVARHPEAACGCTH